MTEEAKRRLAVKTSRNEAALALKEGDCVPIQILGNIFAIVDAGYSMAEVIYDETLEKQKNSIIHYLLTYDPDCAMLLNFWRRNSLTGQAAPAASWIKTL